MFPMHLGLIVGPFVPHNLISAQESPVPLPKFQMAPRLKILMSSGSKKGTQIYYLSLKKSRQANPLEVPQRGSYGERYPLTGHFYISLDTWYIFLTYLSGSPVNDPSLQAPLMESPRREVPCYPRKDSLRIVREVGWASRSLWTAWKMLSPHRNSVTGQFSP